MAENILHFNRGDIVLAPPAHRAVHHLMCTNFAESPPQTPYIRVCDVDATNWVKLLVTHISGMGYTTRTLQRIYVTGLKMNRLDVISLTAIFPPTAFSLYIDACAFTQPGAMDALCVALAGSAIGELHFTCNMGAPFRPNIQLMSVITAPGGELHSLNLRGNALLPASLDFLLRATTGGGSVLRRLDLSFCGLAPNLAAIQSLSNVLTNARCSLRELTLCTNPILDDPDARKVLLAIVGFPDCPILKLIVLGDFQGRVDSVIAERIRLHAVACDEKRACEKVRDEKRIRDEKRVCDERIAAEHLCWLKYRSL